MRQRPVVVPFAFVDPAEVFELFRDEPVAAFLDSSDAIGIRGRFSYIAIDPYRVLYGGETTDPLETIARALEDVPFEPSPNAPPFQGGAVGYLGYELGRRIEDLPEPRPGALDLPEVAIGLYDTVIAFDLRDRQAMVIALEVEGTDRPSPQQRADRLVSLINRSKARASHARPCPSVNWQPDLERTEFEDAVQRAIDYIHAGDIFQANITQRFSATAPVDFDPYALYRRLRISNPAPFSAYLACGEDAQGHPRRLLSASPERFIKLNAEGHMETRPIKGTRPRGATPALEQKNITELLSSPKDRAENLMIVDLLRNDFSRVAVPGTVAAPRLMDLETFARVHHLVSEVRGLLQEGATALDLLRATFPGGSVTGAPKVRAMEIIHELEAVPRGPYCGSIAWMGFDGAMDSSIVIRTMMLAGGRLAAHAGCGIVADSDPAEEYEEMLTKISPLLEVLSEPAKAAS